MEDGSQEEAMHGLLMHCAKQRANGVDDFDIAQQLINRE